MTKYPIDTELKLCPKCGMDSGVRVLVRKGSQEWALVRCELCKTQTKKYEYFPAATRAWNRGNVEVKHENEKSEKA